MTDPNNTDIPEDRIFTIINNYPDIFDKATKELKIPDDEILFLDDATAPKLKETTLRIYKEQPPSKKEMP